MEIITGNYQLVYYFAENVGIIGILAYPKKGRRHADKHFSPKNEMKKFQELFTQKGIY